MNDSKKTKRITRTKTKSVIVTTTAAILVAMGMVGATASTDGAQEKPKIPRKLDEILAVAIAKSPSVVLAEAKVLQARAELNEARLRVTQDVMKLYQNRVAARHSVEAARQKLESTMQLRESGMVQQSDVVRERHGVIQAESDLSGLEARFQYLLGMGRGLDESKATSMLTSLTSLNREGTTKAKRAQRPSIPKHLDSILDTPVGLAVKDLPLPEVLSGWEQAAGGKIGFVLGPDEDWNDYSITAELPNEIKLRDAMLAIHDVVESVCFVVRSYGVLVVSTDRALRIPAATIPDLPLER